MATKNSSSNKLEKKVKKEVKKEVKKTSKKFTVGSAIAVVSCLVVGAVGGVFTEKIITKNDCFELVGNKSFTIAIGEDFVYEEEGYKCISFGKDLTGSVKIDTNLKKGADNKYTIDTSEEGEYYMIYTVESKKYGKIKRVRSFVVGESDE